MKNRPVTAECPICNHRLILPQEFNVVCEEERKRKPVRSVDVNISKSLTGLSQVVGDVIYTVPDNHTLEDVFVEVIFPSIHDFTKYLGITIQVCDEDVVLEDIEIGPISHAYASPCKVEKVFSGGVNVRIRVRDIGNMEVVPSTEDPVKLGYRLRGNIYSAVD